MPLNRLQQPKIAFLEEINQLHATETMLPLPGKRDHQRLITSNQTITCTLRTCKDLRIWLRLATLDFATLDRLYQQFYFPISERRCPSHQTHVLIIRHQRNVLDILIIMK